MGNCYTHKALKKFATSLLNCSGMDAAKSIVIADVLLEGDLLGHDTHGLQLLALTYRISNQALWSLKESPM